MPKISIIIPNFNHAKYLRQRLDSILNQTFQDFELILLDDCSTDNSRDILLSYKGHPKVCRIIFNDQNSGSPFNQWNKGIELAKGEYIWIAESDDWADPEFLECMLNKVEKHPNVGLAYALARYQLNDHEPWKTNESGEVQLFNGSDFIKKKLLYTNVIYNVSMTLFRRNFFFKIQHSLYENMRLCGDWFFYVLLSEQADVLSYNKILSNYRMHSTNISPKEEKLGKSFLEGIEILDYIVKKNKDVKPSDYSFKWAKQWVKYKVKFEINSKTNITIFRRMIRNHKLIVFHYIVYRIYYYFKSLCRK